MKPVDRLLAVAAAEVGYLEKSSNRNLDGRTANAGDANFTKYARDLDKMRFYNGPKNGFAWCAVFAAWCFVQAFGVDTALEMTGQKLGGYGAGCAESVRYYKAMGRFYKYSPQPGDQIFFADGRGGMAHTGIVERAACKICLSPRLTRLCCGVRKHRGAAPQADPQGAILAPARIPAKFLKTTRHSKKQEFRPPTGKPQPALRGGVRWPGGTKVTPGLYPAIFSTGTQ